MITSYTVGSVFDIVDRASPTLIKIADQLLRIDALAKSARSALDALAKTPVGGLSRSLTGLNKNLDKVVDKATLAKDGLVTGMAKAEGAMTAATATAGKLTAELAAAAREGAALGRLRIGGPGGGGAGPGGGGGGGNGGHPRPGRGGGHGASMAGHYGLQLGILGFFGAGEVGHGLKEVLKHAGELTHVQEQMIQGGFKQVEIAHATTEAWKQAEKYGLNVGKVLGDIKELALPFGSVDHAIEFIEPLEKMKIVLNAVSEGKGTAARDAVYKMARSGELKGLQDPHDFLSYFEGMTKAISASGGKITPNDFAQVTQYGRLSSMGWNEEFYTKYLPTAMQTMNASGAGTALMSLFGTLVQGKVSKRSLGLMDDLGLITDRSKIIYDNKGDPKGFNPGAVASTSMLVANPFEWAQKVLLPLLEKKYGDISVDANKMKAIEDLGGLFGNRTSAQAIAELALRGKTFNKDAALIGNAKGTEGADRLLSEDPKVVAEKLHGAWENLLTAIGGPGVATAVAGMNALASGITSLTKFAQEHPEAMKNVLAGLTGLAAGLGLLAVGGAIAGAALLVPGGIATLAIGGLVSVLAGIAAINWSVIKDGFVAAVEAVANVIQKAWDTLKSLNPFSKTSFEGGGEGIGGMVHRASLSDGSFTGAGTAGGGVGPIVARGAAGIGTGTGDSWQEAIMRAEGTAGKDPYNVVLGNGKYGLPSKPLTEMTLAEAYAFGRTVRARHGSSSALGAFQIVGRTMKSHMGAVGLGWNDKFSPENQRKLADHIRRTEGWGAWQGFHAHPNELARAKRGGAYVPPPPPPTAPPPPARAQVPIVKAELRLDGEKVASVTARHMARAATHPRSVGGPDTHGYHTGVTAPQATWA